MRKTRATPPHVKATGTERKIALEKWLLEDVVAGHRDYLAAPEKAVPADQILSRIKQRRQSELSEPE